MSESLGDRETKSLVEQLGFEDGDGRWFYGLHGGYAVAVRGEFNSGVPELSCLFPALAPHTPVPSGFVFQIRHAGQREGTPAVQEIDWSERLRRLMEERAVEIILDERIAWLDIDKPEKIPAEVTPVDLLEDVLVGLDAAGVQGAGTTCHYCGERQVEHLTFSDGRVAQICAECFAAKVEEAHAPVARVPAATRRCVLWALLTAVGGSIIWVGSWVLFDLVIAVISNGSGSVSVPQLVLLLIGLAFVSVMAGPPILAIRSVRGRGDLSAGLIAGAAVAAGLLLGEALHATWLAYGWTGQVAPVQSLLNIGFVWSMQDGSVLAIKALSALVAIVAAFFASRSFSKPLVL